MNAHDASQLQPGAPVEGGYFAGLIRVLGDTYAVIVAPKAEGEHPKRAVWGPRGKDIAGARSFFDGAANTLAMAEGGSALAQWAMSLNIGGHTDWYLPSRDELELLYRNLKPTSEENWTYRGDNPSSVPVGYPYEHAVPAQTAAVAFQSGGAETLEDEWYWSSTQYSAHNAWGQYFDDGGQGNDVKSNEGRARAVRRFKVSP